MSRSPRPFRIRRAPPPRAAFRFSHIVRHPTIVVAGVRITLNGLLHRLLVEKDSGMIVEIKADIDTQSKGLVAAAKYKNIARTAK